MTLLEEVKELDFTLENDGYKTWSYTRLTVAKIIKLLGTEQLNKPVVSGKRPFQCPNCQATLQEVEMTNRDIIDALAACASGAVDTVAARGIEMCGSDCCLDDGRCEHCQKPITDVRKSSEGQP